MYACNKRVFNYVNTINIYIIRKYKTLTETRPVIFSISPRRAEMSDDLPAPT